MVPPDRLQELADVLLIKKMQVMKRHQRQTKMQNQHTRAHMLFPEQHLLANCFKAAVKIKSKTGKQIGERRFLHECIEGFQTHCGYRVLLKGGEGLSVK